MEIPVSGNDTETSIIAEEVDVTIRESTSDPKLHYCIRERDKCIQIGECCTYVEISINGSNLESMISQGQLSLSGETQDPSGKTIPVFQIHWSDIADVKQIKYYVSKLKVELNNAGEDIKAMVMAEIFHEMPDDNMEKIRNIVDRIFRIINGKLVNINSGCLELTIINDSERSAGKLKDQETLEDFEKFFTRELVTEKILKIKKDICFKIRLLSTKEISRSDVMKYRFAPVTPSNLQSAMQAVETYSTEKQEEIVALVEDRLKNATAQITQTVEESLSNHSKVFKEDLEGVRSEIHRQQQVISTEVINQLMPRFNEMLLTNLLPRIQESIRAPQSRDLPQHSPILEETIPQPVMESLGAEARQQLDLESLEAEETQKSFMESRGASHVEKESEPVWGDIATDVPKSKDLSGELEDISIDELSEISRKRPFRRKTSSAATTSAATTKSVEVKSPERQITDIETKYQFHKQERLQLPDVEVKEISGEYIQKFLELMMGDIEKEGYKEKSEESPPIMMSTTSDSLKTKDVGKGTTPWIRKYMNETQIKNAVTAIRKAKSDLRKFELHKSEAVEAIALMTPYIRNYDSHRALIEYFHHKTKKENVAFINCTRGAEIVHPFPCHWGDVSDHLQHQAWKSDFGEKWNSVLTGLLIALYVIADTYKILNVGRYHRVLPSITIFGDEYRFIHSGSQIFEFIEEMNYFNINPHFIIMPQRLKYFKMAKHQETEILIGKALTYIKEPKNDTSNHQTLLEDFLSTISDDVERRLFELRIVSILNIPPPLGTRVRWNALKTYEGEWTGTVVKHIDPCLVQVIFDDGKEQCFEWCFDQNYLTFSPPPKPTTKEQLPVGTLVQRGKDWNYGNQDGGENEIGVVINREKVQDGNLERQVCWRSPFAQNKINMYRFGDQEQFDIQELNDTPQRRPPAIPDKFVQWEEVGKYEPLPVPTCAILDSISEDSTKNEVKEVIISLRQRQMMITKSEKDFKMVDMADDTKYTLRKKDKMLSREDYLFHKYMSYYYF